MSTYGLARLFEPSSVALVGGSPRERSLGRKVLENLGSGDFAGPIFLVNPKHREIGGMASAPNLSALPSSPDLVVITAPPAEVPSIVRTAGEIGCAAAVIITAGLGHGPGSLAEQCRSVAYQHGLRIVGPNGIGVARASAIAPCNQALPERMGTNLAVPAGRFDLGATHAPGR